MNKMNKLVFTVEEYNGANNAGPKAKEDINKFLKDNDFQILQKNFKVHSKFHKLIDYFFTIPNIFNNSENFEEIFFQYPTYSSFLMRKLIPTLKSHSKRLYFIVHDIESMRLFPNDENYLAGEVSLLNLTDGIIVHTKQMKSWLRNKGVKVPIVILKIFDYDNPVPINKNIKYNQTVCFAGNLSKSSFLEKLSLSRGKLEVFGPNPSSYGRGINYNGQFSPDELPKHLEQNFGLVWDGNKTDTCSGKYGEYMKYNAPHKVSLYLSSGIPVIIWKKAALASFIEENKLGFTINNLNELDDKLMSLSQEQFVTYKKNVESIAEKLRKGFFIKQAVNEIEKSKED
jgi:hypothetical protein